MRVNILGCGPAGLMAAHAVVTIAGERGVSIDLAIFSRKQPSPLFGAQYLHKPIPGIYCGDSRLVEYRLQGTPDDYKRKVYGRMWDGSVSPEDLAEQHRAWDIRETYRQLWMMYSDFITDTELDPAGAGMLAERADWTFNSVPRDALCHAGHNFAHTQIVAAGDAPALGIDLARSGFRCIDESVVCNGLEHPSWYRMSRVFGHTPSCTSATTKPLSSRTAPS